MYIWPNPHKFFLKIFPAKLEESTVMNLSKSKSYSVVRYAGQGVHKNSF